MPIDAYERVRVELKHEFLKRKTKNSSYSMRRFAEQLGLSSGALSELMSGKRPITRKLAQTLGQKLGLKSNPLAAATTRVERQALTLDQFALIAEIEHLVLLNLPKLKSFTPRLSWISEKVGRTVQQVKAALERLERLGLIERVNAVAWRRKGAPVETPENIKNLAIQKAHLEALARAEQALTGLEPAERDFSFVVIPASAKNLPLIQKRLREVQDEVSKMAGDGPHEDVYQVSMQVFPLTRKDGK